MKHVDLIRRITDEGAVLARSVGGHDIYRSVITGATLYRVIVRSTS